MIISEKRRLVIIPARAGSKRIPNKNIKNFCGNPIIYYPIEAIIKSNLFCEIHVSTDRREIVNAVNLKGIKVDFLRPKNLSDDHTPLMPVIKYVLEEYIKREQYFDEIWIVLPCSPFLKARDLVNASQIFNNSLNNNFLMTVTEYSVPIEWAFKINKDGYLDSINKGAFAIRSQDLEKKYYDTGLFYAYRSEFILKSNESGSDENILPYFLKKGETIDIDDMEDWTHAEKLYKTKHL